MIPWMEKIRRLPMLRMEAGPFTTVDLDRGGLRIVYAEHRGAVTKVRKLEQVDLPAGLDMGDPKAVGELLGKALKASSMVGAGIVMAVPRSQVVIKSLSLPMVSDPAELAGMVRFQVEKELPFRLDEAAIDFTVGSHYDVEAPGGTDAEGVRVLVAAARLPVVEYYRQVAAAARVRLLRLSLRPYANACSVLACMDEREAGPEEPGVKRGNAKGSAGESESDIEETTALVHLTPDEAEIDVLAERSLAFSRSAAVRLGPPGAGAGATPGASEDDAAAIEGVVGEVARSLRSYQAVHSDRRIQHVLLAGDTGHEQRVADGLSERLNIKCEVFNPAVRLGLSWRGRDASAFSAAIGLALGHRRSQILPFDFLRPVQEQATSDPNRARNIRVAALSVIAMLTIVLAGVVYLQVRRASLASLQARHKLLLDENKRTLALAKRVQQIHRWQESGRDWLDQWALLSAAFPPAPDVYVTGLRISADDAINFTVRARNGEVITDLSKRLNDVGYDVKPGPVNAREDALGYTQTTELRLTITPKVKIDLPKLTATTRPADDISGEPPAPKNTPKPFRFTRERRGGR